MFTPCGRGNCLGTPHIFFIKSRQNFYLSESESESELFTGDMSERQTFTFKHPLIINNYDQDSYAYNIPDKKEKEKKKRNAYSTVCKAMTN